MSQRKIRFTTILMILIIGMVLIVGGYLFRSFLLRVSQDNGQLMNLDDEDPDLFIEPFERIDYNNETGKRTMLIKAARAKGFILQHRYILEDVRESHFWQDDGTDIAVESKKAEFNERTGDITLTGDVHIKIINADPTVLPLDFTAQDVTYDNESGVFQTDGPVTFQQGLGRISGTGLRMERNSQKIWLYSSVVGQIPYQQQQGSTSFVIHVKADTAFYDHKIGDVRFEGNAQASSTEGTLRANTFIGSLRDDNRSLLCSGDVYLIYRPQIAAEQASDEKLRDDEKNSDSENQADLRDKEKSAEPTQLWTDSLYIHRQARFVQAKNNVRLSRGQQRMRADNLDLFFEDDQSSLAAIHANGNIVIEEDKRVLSGQTMHYSLQSDRMVVTGNPKLVSPVETLEGTQFLFFPEQKLYSVKGKVKGFAVLGDSRERLLIRKSRKNETPSQSGKTATPSRNVTDELFFKSDFAQFNEIENTGYLEGQVFITQNENSVQADRIFFRLSNQKRELEFLDARENIRAVSGEYNMSCSTLTFTGVDRKAILEGNCRIWQASSSVEAPQIILYTEREELIARDGVKTLLVGQIDNPLQKSNDTTKGPMPKQNVPEKSTDTYFTGGVVTILSETLQYNKQTRQALFENEVSVSRTGNPREQGTMKCETLRILLHDKKQEIKELEALEDVVITQSVPNGNRTIKGDRAIYDGEVDLLTVEGKKVSIDDPQNSIECSRAQFSLAQDIYVIEGQLSQSVHFPDGRLNDGDGKPEGRSLRNRPTPSQNTR